MSNKFIILILTNIYREDKFTHNASAHRRPGHRAALFRKFGNPLLRQRRETLGEAKDAARAGPDSPAVQAHALHATLLKSPANRPKKRTQEWERTPTRRSDRDDTNRRKQPMQY